ncbi:hypothetical protein Agau_C100081 [Agrobacterium tumefaciens F2]|nr:hypothetical protein Agau_C100081 [Agrobacterium tumefaciens F2]
MLGYDRPNHIVGDLMIFMTKNISDTANLLPRYIWCEV